MLILYDYDSHLIYQFMWYYELHKMILLQLSAHSTHFLQSLDVVIFQQWKHWHTEAIDLHIRKDIDEFNHQTFLANLESIQQLILKFSNIKSVFCHCDSCQSMRFSMNSNSSQRMRMRIRMWMSFFLYNESHLKLMK